MNEIDKKLEELIKLLVPAYAGKLRESATVQFKTYQVGWLGRRTIKIEINADVEDHERSITFEDNDIKYP